MYWEIAIAFLMFLSGLIVTVAVAVGPIGRSRCLARREKLDTQAKPRDS